MKCFSAITGIFLHLLLLLPIDAPAQQALDLFIWAGQSNAQGWMGDASSYPETEQELDESIRLHWTFVDHHSSGGKWVPLQAQAGRFPKGHFGPEVRFARELKKVGYNPAIFKYTKGATGLARDWKSSGEGGIYDRMIEDLKSAIKLLEEENFKVNVRGFIWIQGETDAGNENTAKEYQANLREMIHDLRRNVINESNLKIILGVDEQHPFVKERPTVVEAQKRLAADDATIAFTSMLGLPKADATHLTPEGLVAHGKRIFEAYLSLLPENEKSQLTTFPGEKTEWNGFTSDEEALAYAAHPVENLEALAAAKVPIMHMIGLNDQVVPPEENTFVLVDRYIKLGGPATVVPCTEGKHALFGHHFPIETPRLGADFIRYHTELPKPLLNAESYHKQRQGIRNSRLTFQRDKRGRVAFLGGSITYNDGWRDSISNYLQKRFPDTKFQFINAGIPSMGSTPAAFRLQRDVLAAGSVDLLFVEAAVNDASNGRSAQEQIRAMEGIVRHVRRNNSATDIVIMHFVDPPKMERYRLGQVPEVIEHHEKVADHYGIPSIHLAREVTERIDAGEFSWEEDFKDLHPSPFGQGVYFRSMKTFLENAWDETGTEDNSRERYVLPQPLDPANYDNGVLIEPGRARIRNGWKLLASWTPDDNAGTRANYLHVPMLITQEEGAVLEFDFSGNAVGIAVAAGPDAGMIEYRIDNSDWQKQDLFTKWSLNLHLPWYYTLAAGLTEGEHVLQIRTVGEKNPQSSGNACRIRYFFLNK